MDFSEKYFAKRLWGLCPAMTAGAIAFALCGCGSQLDDVDGLYTQNKGDSVAVAFNAQLADGLDIDHDVIPMRSVWIDGTETPQYNNFKFYSGQLAILKELDDGRYVVYRTLEPVLNAQGGNLFAQHTDYIFSSMGEELGFIGCVVIMLMELAIIARCVYVGVRCQDYMRRLVCFGAASALMFQVTENPSRALLMARTYIPGQVPLP